MFTVVTHKNLADAENYFDEHLAQNDYDAAGEICPGQWIGAGAERLGVKSEARRWNQAPEMGAVRANLPAPIMAIVRLRSDILEKMRHA
jgi:hypothetical protein